MARKTAQKRIGEHEIIVTQWGAYDSLEYAAMAGRLLGDAFREMIDPETGGIRAKPDNVAMLVALCQGARGGEARTFLTALVNCCQVRLRTKQANGQSVLLPATPLEPIFDDAFAGNLQGIGELVAFGLQHNFGSFLGGGGISPVSLDTPIVEAPPSSEESTGSSGEPSKPGSDR